ncbi:MAG TPA: hypothetical protein VGP72_13915 [Planctomycetota bacterium]|jgi:hypothetical protein
MKRRLAIMMALCVITLFSANVTRAWWSGGHHSFTRTAISKLPEDVPAFLRNAAAEVSEISSEPDIWKHPSAPHLKSTEHPEHFIDIEYLDGQPIPKQRFDLTKIYVNKNVDLAQGGFLPYSIQEGYERLMVAFAEYRKHPEAPGLQQRILVYAGWLAHYCQDAGMPLHTTRIYDGKPNPDPAAKPFQKGIHAKMDAYPERNGFTPEVVGEGMKAEHLDDVWAAILATIDASHKLVETCYELDLQGGFDKEPAKSREMMLERSKACTKLTLDIWYSAWIDSAKLEFTKKE